METTIRKNALVLGTTDLMSDEIKAIRLETTDKEHEAIISFIKQQQDKGLYDFDSMGNNFIAYTNDVEGEDSTIIITVGDISQLKEQITQILIQITKEIRDK